jgi:hypothetical protein
MRIRVFQLDLFNKFAFLMPKKVSCDNLLLSKNFLRWVSKVISKNNKFLSSFLLLLPKNCRLTPSPFLPRPRPACPALQSKAGTKRGGKNKVQGLPQKKAPCFNTGCGVYFDFELSVREAKKPSGNVSFGKGNNLFNF